VWQLAGQSSPRALRTTFTLGADTPDVMAQGAVNYAEARAIKVKLTGDLDLDSARVRAIRAARPDLAGSGRESGLCGGDLGPLIKCWSPRGFRCSNSRWRADARPIWRARLAHPDRR
jgi:hypothetical protein